ncbi:MAG: stage II sporulation protein M [Candidatus Obscuribacterales bacterium]|nr:stage II sporulation protein M [Candidatus Obscuribacterales bacterium]
MNIERWTSGRRPVWQELEELLKRVDKKGLTSLSKNELRSLGRLYRAVASDLSRARAIGVPANIIVYLNNLVVKGHNQVYQSQKNRWQDLWHFLWVTFPAIFRANIIYVFVAFLLSFLPSVATWYLVRNDINLAHLEVQPGMAMVSDDLWGMIEKKQMWTDAVQEKSPVASSWIITNNIKVALMAFVLGLTGGIGTVYVLVSNGLLIGGTFAVCSFYDLSYRLAAFVAPHGVFELSAIFISGGAGLLLAKGILFPGNLSRLDSLRINTKQAFILFAGCVPVLFIAGIIEGFISPRSDIPQAAKYAVSFATLILLLLYLFVPRTVETSEHNKR